MGACRTEGTRMVERTTGVYRLTRSPTCITRPADARRDSAVRGAITDFCPRSLLRRMGPDSYTTSQARCRVISRADPGRFQKDAPTRDGCRKYCDDGISCHSKPNLSGGNQAHQEYSACAYPPVLA